MANFSVDDDGYYGNYGGAYIPEMLYHNVHYLAQNYVSIIEQSDFKQEFHYLLKHYVGRPTPLYFAKNLSRLYDANIFLKREDLCHTGAHKINNAVGQILIAEKIGKKRIIAETGAGQHGVATATVCALKGMKCVIYMGATDIERQQPNVARMKLLGAEVVPVHSGSATLKDATNEAIRDWINNPNDTHYIIGSVVGPHPFPDMVARLQSVIGKETQEQLLEYYHISSPDYVMACVGGGSNAAGLFYPFLDDEKVNIIAAEAGGKGVDTGKTAATTRKGTIGVLHGSKTLLMQNEHGQVVEPYSISAGLDYPGIGPLHAYLHKTKRVKYFSINDDEALESVKELARAEGIIQALETAHITACLKKISFKKNDTVVVGLSGRGDKDLQTYMENIG